MKSFKCKECDAEFESRRSLHAHLKAHKIKIDDYYKKHFLRFDLYTHKPIEFKNVDQYLTSDFNRVSNLKRWIKREPERIVKPYLVSLVRKKIEERTDKVLGEAQLLSYDLPSANEIEKLFGSYDEFCKQIGYKAQFPDKMPSEYESDCMDKKILVDTREKKPLSFRNAEKFSLDFGDYALIAKDFTYTFVDRKSVADFVSSLGLDYERIDKEIDRCQKAGCYLFFVVEGQFKKIKEYIVFNKWSLESTYAHVMHNMRELLRKYPNNCQFVFTQGRGQSELIIPKLLHCGKRIWKVDVQKYLNYGMD